MVTAVRRSVIVVGMGEVGELFAKGFLKLGHPVFPVLRGMDMAVMASTVPGPELVLVAVGEDDLRPALASLPPQWLGNVGLVQNELLPRDWVAYGIADPTVTVVWFDKKKGRPFVSVLPSVVSGPKAGWVVRALMAADAPANVVSADGLLYELVRKNLYILTINIAGMLTGGTVAGLWRDHRELAEAVAREVLDVQEWLAQSPLPRDRLIAGMVEGFEGDPDHICTGRSAPARLRRLLDHARAASIATPTLDGIAGV